MQKAERSILSDILRKQVEALGYASLAKFTADHPEIGYSYEVVRQVVYGGRTPRAETLLAILSALRFSPLQIRKILGLCFQGFPLADQDARRPMPQVPTEARGKEDLVSGTDLEDPSVVAAAGAGARPSLPATWEDPGEILSSLNRSLPRVPRNGNEDFWETIHALALLAEKKATRLARRDADQPLLFGKEPEAVYHLLVRKGAVPSYMSKGETVPLAFSPSIEYRDRFRGALLGSAIGEVLGRCSQGLSPGDIQVLFGRIDSFPARPAAGPSPSSLLLAQVLLREKGLDPQSVASAYAADSPGGMRDTEEFSRNLLERGYPWFDAGTSEPMSAPAARIVPLALLRAGDFRRLKLEAGIDAAITHPSPVSIAGSIVQAAAVARLLHTPSDALDVIGFSRALAHAVSGIEPDRGGGRGKSGRPVPTLWRRLGTELTALLLRRADIEEVRELLGNGDSVLEGIPFSWACFLRTPEDFADSVLSAVNAGGHAANNGAMAGSLAGAYRGVSGIPDRLLQGFPWRQEMEAAADALLALARRGATAS